jgi:hypothetical protein
MSKDAFKLILEFLSEDKVVDLERLKNKTKKKKQNKIIITNSPTITNNSNADTLLKLHEIYDNHRNTVLWFLEQLDANNYEEYLEKYSDSSFEHSHFIAVCGFFELSGALVSYGMIDQNL